MRGRPRDAASAAERAVVARRKAGWRDGWRGGGAPPCPPPFSRAPPPVPPRAFPPPPARGRCRCVPRHPSVCLLVLGLRPPVPRLPCGEGVSRVGCVCVWGGVGGAACAPPPSSSAPVVPGRRAARAVPSARLGTCGVAAGPRGVFRGRVRPSPGRGLRASARVGCPPCVASRRQPWTVPPRSVGRPCRPCPPTPRLSLLPSGPPPPGPGPGVGPPPSPPPPPPPPPPQASGPGLAPLLPPPPLHLSPRPARLCPASRRSPPALRGARGLGRGGGEGRGGGQARWRVSEARGVRSTPVAFGGKGWGRGGGVGWRGGVRWRRSAGLAPSRAGSAGVRALRGWPWPGSASRRWRPVAPSRRLASPRLASPRLASPRLSPTPCPGT